MVDLAGVEPGSRVLDVAAGYGEPSLTAAARAGAEGAVVATDISPEMLALGTERAADAGLDNLEFVQSDAASLDFPEASFDVALSRFGLIFEPDGEAAATRIRQLLKPGGRFAISSWGSPDRVPFIAIPMQTAIRRLGVRPPPPGTPGPFSYPTPGALCNLLETAGFSEVEAEQAEVTFEWHSPEAFTTFVKETVPPVSEVMTGQPPAVQDETWEAIAEAIRDATRGDAALRLSNLALLAAGRA